MRAIPLFVVILVCFVCFNSNLASACGESMFRVGKGVHYRAYSAPIPGTVLVYARTDDERAIAEQLQQAGHQVLVVENDMDLAMELNDQEFDVIVAPASKRAAVESGASGLSSPPDWVPVFESGTPDAQSVRADYGKGVGSEDDIRKYLKAIHKSMKSHSGD